MGTIPAALWSPALGVATCRLGSAMTKRSCGLPSEPGPQARRRRPVPWYGLAVCVKGDKCLDKSDGSRLYCPQLGGIDGARI